MWMGPGKHIIVYYVAAKRLVNFVGIVEQDAWTKESWTEPGDVKDLRTGFANWDSNLRAIIAMIQETFIWGLFDRAPLPRWSVGHVTLLGDACHPMLPFMAQGAAQALEDGTSLTACLASVADVPAALRLYEKLRLPRTTRIQAMGEHEQDAISSAGRACSRGARCPNGRRHDGLVDQSDLVGL
jgi:salicylate hydroxylase